MKRSVHFVFITLSIILVCACGLSPGDGTPPQLTSEPSTAIAQPSPTDTPANPSQLVYIERGIGWEHVRVEFGVAVEKLAEAQGWQLVSITGDPDTSNYEQAALIIVLGGDDDVTGLIEANPQALFVFVGVASVSPGKQVAVIGPEGMRPDQVAFLSGYISALTTPDWRIGVIGIGPTGEGQAVIKSFINGGIFFCGLCRPGYPPFHDYPTSVDVTALDAESIGSGLERIRDQGVTTIGLGPSFSSEVVDLAMEAVASEPILWIGPNPPLLEKRDRWIATIQPDPGSALLEVFEMLSNGEMDIRIPMPLAVLDVNDEILTEGKLRLVLQTRDALVIGTIDTGVDPSTGQER